MEIIIKMLLYINPYLCFFHGKSVIGGFGYRSSLSREYKKKQDDMYLFSCKKYLFKIAVNKWAIKFSMSENAMSF